jgi:hypothetical protein
MLISMWYESKTLGVESLPMTKFKASPRFEELPDPEEEEVFAEPGSEVEAAPGFPPQLASSKERITAK